MTTVKVIKPESIVKIEVNGNYFARVQALTTWLTQQVSPEELAQQTKAIANNEPLSEIGEHFLTVLLMIQEIESKAIEQNLVVDEEIPEPIME